MQLQEKESVSATETPSQTLPSPSQPLPQEEPEVHITLAEKLYRGVTSPFRIMPDFLIVGTQRGGTTSLYNYLQECPGIGPAMVKELHYFDKQFHKGNLWYRAHFPTLLERATEQRKNGHAYLTGEASAYYLFHPHVPKRIHAVIPQTKIIILLRNPVTRAYSQYWLEVELDRESLSFEEALEREEERITREAEKVLADERYVSPHHSRYSYKARGRYVEQLPRWLSLFPKEQVLILKSEDLYKNTGPVVDQVLTFLGLPGLSAERQEQGFKTFNYVKQEHPKIDPKTREHLQEYFAPHNAELYKYLGRDFGWDK